MIARVRGFRAAAEAGLVAFVLAVVLLTVVPAQNVDPVWAALALGFLDIGVVAGTLSAVRARRSAAASRWRAFGREVGLLAITLVVVVVALVAANVVAHTYRPSVSGVVPDHWLAGTGFPPGAVISFLASGSGGWATVAAFAVVRTVVVLWPRWDRLRRGRLVWSITHGQLVAIMVLGVVAGVVLLGSFILGDRGPLAAGGDPSLQDPLVRPLVGFVAAVTGGFAIVAVIAFVVLPLAALVSFATLRPTTRRLVELTGATGSIRRGDLGTRVAVAGEDEVAGLQADFNAMAADLERSVGALERERDTVHRLLDARRELLTAVSHELRTPVATLRAYLESSLEHWDGTPPATLRRDLEVMDREAERLQRLIEDLFALARAEVGSLAVTTAEVDVAPVLARAVEAMRAVAADRGRVELVLDLPASLPAAVADEDRLEQVVRNLLANAIRHTPPGGVVRVAAEGEPADRAPDRTITIHVEDTGEGIEPTDLERIWERFYRTDAARDRDRGGAGLGLALVKELTEAMGGRVTASSTVGVGSRFSVTLPATGLRHVDDGSTTA